LAIYCLVFGAASGHVAAVERFAVTGARIG
jgi:hypothetical protein